MHTPTSQLCNLVGGIRIGQGDSHDALLQVCLLFHEVLKQLFVCRFEDAISPLVHLLPNVDLHQYMMEARQGAERKSRTLRGMWKDDDTRNEKTRTDGIAVIILAFTCEPFYSMMNEEIFQAFQQGQPERLFPWLRAIKLLDDALSHLPPKFCVQQQRAFRLHSRSGSPTTIDTSYPRAGDTAVSMQFLAFSSNLASSTQSDTTLFIANLIDAYDVSEFIPSASSPCQLVVRPFSVFCILWVDHTAGSNVIIQQLPQSEKMQFLSPYFGVAEIPPDECQERLPNPQPIDYGLYLSLQACNDTNDWGTALCGLISNQPITPFMEAIAPLFLNVMDLVKKAKNAFNAAREIVKPGSGLWVDGIAAIQLYTQAWPTVEGAFFAKMKQAMWAQNHPELSQFLPAIKLIDEALVRLPRAHRMRSTRVYRGERWRYARGHYSVGSHHLHFGFTSTSASKRVIMEKPEFCGPEGRRTLFIIELLEGYNIRDFSSIKEEEEVLIRPLALFKVLSSSYGEDGLDVVHMEQVPRPYDY